MLLDQDLIMNTFSLYTYHHKKELKEIDKIISTCNNLSTCLLNLKTKVVQDNPELKRLLLTRLKYRRMPIEVITLGRFKDGTH